MTSRSRISPFVSPSIAPGWSAPTGRPMRASFDVAYLACLPNLVVMAAADEAELVHMVATAAAYDSGPIALRYPRGEGVGVEHARAGRNPRDRHGPRVARGLAHRAAFAGHAPCRMPAAADELGARGLSTTVADARFAKPLDTALIHRLASNHEVLITVEEGSAGGFGAFVLHHLADAGLLDKGLRVRTMTLPDVFLDHDKPDKLYARAGLDAKGIVAKALAALPRLEGACVL